MRGLEGEKARERRDELDDSDGWMKAEDRRQTADDCLRGKAFDNLKFHSTFEIIEAAEKGLLPDKAMINTHPQRWTVTPWRGQRNWFGRMLRTL